MPMSFAVSGIHPGPSTKGIRHGSESSRVHPQLDGEANAPQWMMEALSEALNAMQKMPRVDFAVFATFDKADRPSNGREYGIIPTFADVQ